MLRCHTPPQCRLGAGAGVLLRQRSEVAVRCRAQQVSGVEAAAGTPAARAAVEGGERTSLAERLRLGSLLEDGLSYKESFIVRCYEVGINKTATVETIANLLQVRPPPPMPGFLPVSQSYSSLVRFVLSVARFGVESSRIEKCAAATVCVGGSGSIVFVLVLDRFGGLDLNLDSSNFSVQL